MRPSQKIGRNDPCVCGSDRKFKKCCQRLEIERNGGSSQYAALDIKEMVLREIESFKEIFEVKLTESDLILKAHISNSDVQLFVERSSNLWNSKSDLLPFLPKAEDMKFRSLYFGTADMLSTVNLLARYSLYCDQIIVIDPFSVFINMDPNFRTSPYRDPQAWVHQIVRDGVYLCSMEKWIQSDLVIASAFPLGFGHPVRQKHIEQMQSSFSKMSEER